eukprot:jgi/Ulvmu1/4843/UM020_0129.1
MSSKDELVGAAHAPRSLEIKTTVEECMETLICKLHLLNYRHRFLGSKFGKRRAPLDKTCFTGIATDRSPADLFYTFFNLAAWLISEYGQVKVSPLKEGEDSATAIRSLIQLLRQLNFAVPATLSASQLQGGSGREICGILNGLVDWALQRSAHQFHAPQHPVEEDDGNVELMEVHEDADMLASIAAPHSKFNGMDADDELSQLAPRAEPTAQARRNQAADTESFIIENKIDRERWDLEYQQVAPRLQIRIAAEARDWRTHLDGVIQSLQGTFSEATSESSPAQQQASVAWTHVKDMLKHVQNDVNEQLNKLEIRERFLNNEFASRTEEYRNRKESFEASKELYQDQVKQMNDGMVELQACLDQIEEMQGELEDRTHNSASGAGPVAKVRKAIGNLKSEMKQMDVRLGITRHQLLHMHLRHQVHDV